MAWRIARSYSECSEGLSDEWRARLRLSLAFLDGIVWPTKVSLGLAHRDFAPWNTRRTPDGELFVFDWEFASEGYPFWYDGFHHRFMSQLLIRGPAPRRALLDWTGDRELEGSGQRFFLAYLVELALSYHEMRLARGDTRDDAVLQEAARLLDLREEWLS